MHPVSDTYYNAFLPTLPDGPIHCRISGPLQLVQCGRVGWRSGVRASQGRPLLYYAWRHRSVGEEFTTAGEQNAWLVLGDSYNNRAKVRRSSHRTGFSTWSDDEPWAQRAAKGGCRISIEDGTYKEKDLFGIPRACCVRAASEWLDTAQHDHLGKALGDAREREGSAVQLLRVCVPVGQVEALLLRCDSDRRAEWRSRTESVRPCIMTGRNAIIRHGIGIRKVAARHLAGRARELRPYRRNAELPQVVGDRHEAFSSAHFATFRWSKPNGACWPERPNVKGAYRIYAGLD
jgi:hypothetical protein